jgi:selenocysteine-specific elongation factor
LQELIESIQSVLSEAPIRRDIQQPRLSIDRAFSISGFGTVVTGTLVDGSLHVGDEIGIYPQGLKGRIRGLQTHKEKIQTAVPGSRVAVNITGVDVDDIERGDVVAHPGTTSSTNRVDVQFELLDSVGQPIKHNQEVKLFIGAAQRIARVRLLAADELHPGQEGWLQLELDSPVVTARGDRYILRRPSPPATIGGGQVVDANPERRHRRWDEAVIERLEHYLVGDPKDLLIQTLQRLGPSDWKAVSEAAGLEITKLEDARDHGLKARQIIKLPGASDGSLIYLDIRTWQHILQRMSDELDRFHKQHKLRYGMSIEELRSRLQLDPKVAGVIFSQAEAEGVIENIGKMVCKASFRPELSKEQKQQVESLMKRFRNYPYAPPSVKESIAAVGEDIFRYLLESGELIQLSDDVVFHAGGYQSMIQEIKDLIAQQETVTVAEVRDHLDTSRKYVLAMLEHLDSEGITRREDDIRRLV